jgi:hypothetical protein
MKSMGQAVVAWFWIVFAAAWLPAVEPTVSARRPTPTKTVRLLTIGNSFSQDATAYLSDLAAADGNTLLLKTANVGGSPLQLHWEKAQLHEREPNHPDGRYRDGQSLRAILLAGPLDYVTIQQRSYISHDVTTYRPYAAQLQAYVKRYAPQAELLLHETWAYRSDDPRFQPADTARVTLGEPRTQREMYTQLAAAYRTIARELGVRRIPVGTAFFAADSDPNWGYQPDKTFDGRHAQPPALPDQKHSLHVGLRWQNKGDGSPTLSMDGHHASPAGRYLGACVWYEVLFATTCVGNRFLAGLDADDARYLQRTAHEAVLSTK